MEENNQFNNNMVPVLNEVGSVDAYIDSLPPGYRFVPTDDELILHYLMRKVLNKQLPINRFHSVNIYQHHPRDLTGGYHLIRESEWYFFTPRRRKYPRGGRPNRTTNSGYWKATGKPDDIKDANGQVIGSKSTLDYYEGMQREGTKTDWKMHEYMLSNETDPPKKIDGTDMKLNDCVMCKIYKNSRSKTDKNNDNAAKGTIESDQGAIDLPAVSNNITSHTFPDQSVQHPSLLVGESSGSSSTANKCQNPAYYQRYSGPIHNFNKQEEGRVLQPDTNIVTPQAFPNHHQSVLHLDHHPDQQIWNNKLGGPSYYQPFQNGALGNCNFINHQYSLNSAHSESRLSQVMNSSYPSPFCMQEYPREVMTCLAGPSSTSTQLPLHDHAMEYPSSGSVQDRVQEDIINYSDTSKLEGEGEGEVSFEDTLVQFLNGCPDHATPNDEVDQTFQSKSSIHRQKIKKRFWI